MILPLSLASVVILVAAAYVYRRIHRVARDKARFKLAAVRDELLYLVASEKLPIESAVFEHYHRRLDTMLKLDRPVGLEDVVRVLFKTNAKDFDRAINDTRKQIDRLLSNPEAQSDEVRGVLAAYYDSLRFSLVANSSIVKFVMLPVHIIGDRAKRIPNSFLPQRAVNAAKIYNFVDEERKQIAPRRHNEEVAA